MPAGTKNERGREDGLQAGLWEGFLEKRDSHHRNKLIEHYMPVVEHSAKQLYHRLEGQIRLDDVITAGVMGLMEAIEDFDPVSQMDFERYCLPRIKEASFRELQTMREISGTVRQRIRQLEKEFRGG